MYLIKKLTSLSRICLMAILMSGLMVSNIAYAQTNTDVAKVGFFNLATVMSNIPQAKKAEKRLESEFSERKKKLEKLEEGIKKDQDKFERDQQIMSDADKDKARRELRNRSREFKLSVQEYQEDLSLRQNQETSELQKLVRQAVLEVAKDEKYDLIVDQGAVLFASDKVDITKKVMQKLSKNAN